MNGKQLKNSILQWAIQGKLVPQDPNDEPASVLLERIRAEKAQLIKEGKIKKDKNETIIFRGDDNSHYEKLPNGEVRCIDDEIPFEIPSSWCWVRLRNYAEIIGGYAFPSTELRSEKGSRVIRISDISEEGFVNKSIVRYNAANNLDNYKIEVDDILIAMTGGTVGKSLYVESLSEDMLLNQRVAIIRNKWFDVKYLDCVIKSPHVKEFINSRKNSTNDNISMVDIANFLVPVPPLVEQRRIIERIKQLFPIAEKYNKAQAELDKLNTDIYSLLKKSILQEAILGRLVPQDATDEPATKLLEKIRMEKQALVKQGKLKAKDITDSIIYKGDDNKYYEQIGGKCIDISEEIPFDIPENWSWCRLSQCCVRIFSGKSPSYSKTPTKHLIIGQQANQWERIEMQYAKYGTDDYAKNIEEYQYLLDGDVLLNTLGNGTLGRCGIFEHISDKVLTDGHLFVFRTIEKSISRYILYYLTLNYTEINRKADGSTNQTFLNLKKVSNYLIPLPPLNEIKRIVTKKEELYSKL